MYLGSPHEGKLVSTWIQLPGCRNKDTARKPVVVATVYKATACTSLLPVPK